MLHVLSFGVVMAITDASAPERAPVSSITTCSSSSWMSMPARKLVNISITRITGVIFFMSIPPKVRYPSPRHASYLYYRPFEYGKKLQKKPKYCQKTGTWMPPTGCLGEISPDVKPTELGVIFQIARSAAEGGMVDARRTGTKVVRSTTSQPIKKSKRVLLHGKENAAPSPSQMAL